MKRIIIAGIVGGIVYTIWGALAWMVLGIHDWTSVKITDEDAVVAILNENITQEGVYFFPAMPEPSSTMSEAEISAQTDQWMEKYRRGPIGMIAYRPHGADPMMTSMYISGVIISILAALIVAWLLSRSTAMSQSYLARVSFCGTLAIFASIVTHVAFWNWMLMPFDYTIAMVLDVVLGWVVTGAVIAAIVKPSLADAK